MYVKFRSRRIPRKGCVTVSGGLAARLPISRDEDADGNGIRLCGKLPSVVCYVRQHNARVVKEANYWLARINLGIEEVQTLLCGTRVIRVFGTPDMVGQFIRAGEKFNFLRMQDCHPAENARAPRQGQGSGPDKVRVLQPSVFARAVTSGSNRDAVTKQQRAAQDKRNFPK